MNTYVDISSPINWTMPLNKGLRHWWMALPNQNLGNRFRDLTRRKDATITGATPQAARARPGGWGCFLYDGTNDYGQTAAIDLSGTSTLSVSCWLYLDVYSTDSKLALESSATSATNVGAIYFNPNAAAGNFQVRVCTTAAARNSYSFTRPTAAVWHYYTACFDRAGGAQQVIAVYVDGVSQTLTVVDNNTTGTGGFGNHVWNLMARNAVSLFTAGRLDDLRIQDRVLSAPQALASYRASRAGWPQSLRWITSPVMRGQDAGVATSPYYYRHRRRAA